MSCRRPRVAKLRGNIHRQQQHSFAYERKFRTMEAAERENMGINRHRPRLAQYISDAHTCTTTDIQRNGCVYACTLPIV